MVSSESTPTWKIIIPPAESCSAGAEQADATHHPPICKTGTITICILQAQK